MISKTIKSISEGWIDYRKECEDVNTKGHKIKKVSKKHPMYSLIRDEWTNGVSKHVDLKKYKAESKLGDGLFFQSNREADEKPVNDTKLRQGFLEGSNITATDEMTNMISTVRLFETYQKIIQSIDNMNEQSVNSIGRIG